MSTEILYGIHPVAECLAAGKRKVYKLYLARGRQPGRVAAVLALAKARGIAVEMVEANTLQSLTRSREHQGIGVQVSAFVWASFDTLVDGIPDAPDSPFLLLIDSVKDPRNLGALARTALGVGVQAIVLPKDRSAPPTAAAVKASAGALEHVALIRVTNLARSATILKQTGMWVVGLDRDAPQTLFQVDLSGPLALVVGSEEKGIRPLVKRQCDVLASIPQQGSVQSLNASVAGAVAMYEALRQRQSLGGGARRCI